MLVLSRKLGERILIGNNAEIVITVVSIDRGKIRLGITHADPTVPIHREEVFIKIKEGMDEAEARRGSSVSRVEEKPAGH